jgi:hypothetical protein
VLFYEKFRLELKPDEKFRKTIGFLSHLQERMDFLAEISTAVPFFSLPMWLDKDVIGPFNDQQCVLLDYISGI